MGRTYKPESDCEALKIALFEGQQQFLREYEATHGHQMFVAGQMPSLAWKSHTPAAVLVDAMSDARPDGTASG